MKGKTKVVNKIGDYGLTDEQFFKDMKETLKGQINDCNAYRLLCEKRNFDLEQDLKSMDDLGNIPAITANTFKYSKGNFSKWLRVDENTLYTYNLSSATGGDASLTGRTEEDYKATVKSYCTVLSEFGSKEPVDITFLVWPSCDVMTKGATVRIGTDNINGVKLTAFVDPMLNFTIPSKTKEHRYFLLYMDGDNKIGFDMDTFASEIENIHKNNLTWAMTGSVNVIYYNIINKFIKEGKKYNFGPQAYIYVGAGGWNGKKGSISTAPIKHSEFVESVQGVFGIPITNIMDGYGMSESPILSEAHYSVKEKSFIYHIPPWSKMLIRDPNTLEVVNKEGSSGLVEILSPYGVNSYAGAAILVDDIVELVEKDFCSECKRKGKTFKILGRAYDFGITQQESSAGCGAIVLDN